MSCGWLRGCLIAWLVCAFKDRDPLAHGFDALPVVQLQRGFVCFFVFGWLLVLFIWLGFFICFCCVRFCLFGWLFECLMGWLVGWLVGLLVGLSIRCVSLDG